MSEPVHAIFLTHTARPSGAELALVRLTSAMREAGNDVSVLSTADGPIIATLRGRGVPTTVAAMDTSGVKLGGSLGGLARGAIALLRHGWHIGGRMRADRAEVLVAESSKALLLGAIAAIRSRKPLVWHVHDRVSAEYFGLPVAIALRLLGALAARGYAANSRSTLSTLWTLRRPAAVSYPGLDLRAVTERRTQASPDDVVIGMAGRLSQWKGQDVLIDALSLMRTRPRVRLIGDALFGETDYRESLKAQIETLGLGGQVTFTGHVDDPLHEMGRCDIIVHCSRKAEPFGQVIVEGMAVGAAVAATRRGGPSEIIHDQIDGLLVDADDPRQLARVLDELVDDLPLRNRLAAAASQRARAFDVTEGARSMAELLERVIRRRR